MEGAKNQLVWIQLFGDLAVRPGSADASPVRFRSKTAERMLALLALRLGRTVGKDEIAEIFWPESDGDRQSQNFRRALSDVRHAIDDEGHSAQVVLTQGQKVWLNAELVHTDVDEFRVLSDSGFESDDDIGKLAAAIGLYKGPLLSGLDGHWITVQRMELEERFGQSVEKLISTLLGEERIDEALRIGRKAVLAAPLREDVHLSLVSAYASAGLRGEAVRQFEELETLLQDQWGESPSTESVKLLEGLLSPSQSARRVAIRQPSITESSGGAVPAGSRFYISRDCDADLQLALKQRDGTILIHGSRQVGKTSLLLRGLTQARQEESAIAITDLQILSRSQMSDADSFCRALAHGFVTQIGSDLDLPKLWSEWIGPNLNLHTAVTAALNLSAKPVIWAIDEADRLFGTPFADDFFGLIRSWHNLRAMMAHDTFGKLTMIISYATEAHLFIQDINQSPFNVGVRISMSDFSEREIAQLAQRYGMELSARSTLQLKEITGGQPFLTRRALDAMVRTEISVESLRTQASKEDGPFGEHLKRLLFVISRDPETRSEVLRFIRKEAFLNPKSPLRLLAGGMLRRNPAGALEFRVPAYREFLSQYLTC